MGPARFGMPTSWGQEVQAASGREEDFGWIDTPVRVPRIQHPRVKSGRLRPRWADARAPVPGIGRWAGEPRRVREGSGMRCLSCRHRARLPSRRKVTHPLSTPSGVRFRGWSSAQQGPPTRLAHSNPRGGRTRRAPRLSEPAGGAPTASASASRMIQPISPGVPALARSRLRVDASAQIMLADQGSIGYPFRYRYRCCYPLNRDDA